MSCQRRLVEETAVRSRVGSLCVVGLAGGEPYMSVVVCVCVRRWDLDATNGRITDTERAEVLLCVVLALHARHKAGQCSGIGRRERWWQVGI